MDWSWTGHAPARDHVARADGQIAELARLAHLEFEAAQAQFEEVADKDLVDHAIYRLRAAERHYVFLLRLAQDEERLKRTGGA